MYVVCTTCIHIYAYVYMHRSVDSRAYKEMFEKSKELVSKFSKVISRSFMCCIVYEHVCIWVYVCIRVHAYACKSL